MVRNCGCKGLAYEMPTQWLCGAWSEGPQGHVQLPQCPQEVAIVISLEEEEIPEQRVRDLDAGLTALRFSSLPHTALSSGAY